MAPLSSEPSVTPRPSPTVAPSPALRLAAKWARHRRDPTEWGRASFGTGAPEMVLRIRHGAVPLLVRDLGKCLTVLGIVDLSPEVRTWIAALAPAERERFLLGLRLQLMSCPRIGFSWGTIETPGQNMPERIALDQTLQISEDDPASFNRLCDAIQETETVLLRALEYLGAARRRAEETVLYSSTTEAPGELYL
jgi:hypothetical protein